MKEALLTSGFVFPSTGRWKSVGIVGSIVLLASCVWLLSVRPTHAGTYRAFAATSDNYYSTAGNWTGGVVPTAGDEIFIPAGTSTQLTAAVQVFSVTSSGYIQLGAFSFTATGTADVNGGGGINSTGTGAITITGATNVLVNGSVTTTSGTMTFSGAATSTGRITTTSGNMLFSSTYQNNGVLDIGSGTATTTGAFRNT
ncbi:MAG: hypothetical protein Q8R07_01530, partial [Candidatus Uhrbacteria bacterium]|nr:hypothetical protein [Candidatus Uhrbacteria bacterium]